MVLKQAIRNVCTIATVDALENHAGSPVCCVFTTDSLHGPTTERSFAIHWTAHKVSNRYDNFLLLAFAVPFSLDATASPTNEGSTGTLLRLYA